MATKFRTKGRRSTRPYLIHKPQGALHPRVKKVGPEHFGIISVDCAKARSKWMLADFYGQVLVPPTPVPHTRTGLEAMVQSIRQAIASSTSRTGWSPLSRPGGITSRFRGPASRPGLRPAWFTP